MPRPSHLQQVNIIEEINPLSALYDGSNYAGAPSETLKMPREKMDAILLEVVNTEELLDELAKVYTQEQYQKMAQEMQRVIPYIDPTKIVQSDKEFSHVNALRTSPKRRDEKGAMAARRRAAEQLQKKIEKNQSARRQVQGKPIKVTMPRESMTAEKFLDMMRKIELQFANENIANGIDPKAAKGHVLSNESIEELYQIMTRVFGIDNVTGDTALNEFQFTRFSDGSMNIISNSALYNGMLLRPVDQFQPMKEQGEQQRMFSFTLFSKGSEGVTHAREAMAASPSTPTPFNTQLTHPTDRK